MPSPTPSADDRSLPLRERKKQRTRRALAETALRLFLAQGFEETTLEQLIGEVEVSMRTFFRYYSSKEEVAMAAEGELWDAYVEQVASRPLEGAVITFLRDSFVAAVRGLDDEWVTRFRATRGLAARTPALRAHHASASQDTQMRLVGELEGKLGISGREDVRLRLLGEMAIAAFRNGGKNWVRGLRADDRATGTREALIARVVETFDALPGALELSGRTSADAPSATGSRPPQ